MEQEVKKRNPREVSKTIASVVAQVKAVNDDTAKQIKEINAAANKKIAKLCINSGFTERHIRIIANLREQPEEIETTVIYT
jgi:hypothetical protein